jgi:hypothetical protein
MATDDFLERALADLAKADESRHASPHLDAVVIAAFDRRQEGGYLGQSAAAMWQRRDRVVAAVAAMGVIAMIYVVMPDSHIDYPPIPGHPVRVQADAFPKLGYDAGEPIVPGPPAVPLPVARPRIRSNRSVEPDLARTVPTWRDSDDVVHAVQVRMPRAMLSMLGVPIIEPGAEGTVNVEVWLGSDGIARTIRIIP